MNRPPEIAEILEIAERAVSARDLAEQIGLTVEFAEWYPVTAGELHIQDRRVVVNSRSHVPADQVIAHEIAHYLLYSSDLQVNDEEELCDNFAGLLMEDKRG